MWYLSNYYSVTDDLPSQWCWMTLLYSVAFNFNRLLRSITIFLKNEHQQVRYLGLHFSQVICLYLGVIIIIIVWAPYMRRRNPKYKSKNTVCGDTEKLQIISACSDTVRRNQHALSCDRYDCWTHRTCYISISKSVYLNAVRSQTDLAFTCAWSSYNQPVWTNNDVEGWHYRLNRKAQWAGINIYLLFTLLYQEGNCVFCLLCQNTFII